MDDTDVTIEADGSEEGGSEEELEAAESRVDGKLAKVKKELEHVKRERQEYLDGWQRAKADYVNAVKRFEEDKLGAVALGKVAALKAFIPAMDSLKRARSAGELPETFEGIAKQLEDAMRTHGMKPFGEVGEGFNPSLHEALGQDPVESVAKDDTVTAVLEEGWMVGEAVIRPAKVRVGHYEA